MTISNSITINVLNPLVPNVPTLTVSGTAQTGYTFTFSGLPPSLPSSYFGIGIYASANNQEAYFGAGFPNADDTGTATCRSGSPSRNVGHSVPYTFTAYITKGAPGYLSGYSTSVTVSQ